LVSYYGKGADSGRPKATHGIQEDEDFFYTYTRTGKVTKYPKTEADKHQDFLKTVKYQITKTRSGRVESKIRLTPLSPYEIFLEQKKRMIC